MNPGGRPTALTCATCRARKRKCGSHCSEWPGHALVAAAALPPSPLSGSAAPPPSPLLVGSRFGAATGDAFEEGVAGRRLACSRARSCLVRMTFQTASTFEVAVANGVRTTVVLHVSRSSPVSSTAPSTAASCAGCASCLAAAACVDTPAAADGAPAVITFGRRAGGGSGVAAAAPRPPSPGGAAEDREADASPPSVPERRSSTRPSAPSVQLVPESSVRDQEQYAAALRSKRKKGACDGRGEADEGVEGRRRGVPPMPPSPRRKPSSTRSPGRRTRL